MKIPFGPKHAQQASQWITSAIGFGGAASLALCYVTDWKVIVAYIPFYGGKFVKPDE